MNKKTTGSREPRDCRQYYHKDRCLKVRLLSSPILLRIPVLSFTTPTSWPLRNRTRISVTAQRRARRKILLTLPIPLFS